MNTYLHLTVKVKKSTRNDCYTKSRTSGGLRIEANQPPAALAIRPMINGHRNEGNLEDSQFSDTSTAERAAGKASAFNLASLVLTPLQVSHQLGQS